jgi:TonB-dependent receptor
MKVTAARRFAAVSDRQFTLKACVAFLLGAGLMSAASLWAQEVAASVDAPTIVTVTGVRKSAESAAKIKKESDQVMDSIVADDIGKFPDTNVANTLAHVTGVQVLRNGFEVTGITLDGLPDVATLLNGRDVFTSTGRYISLADIPSTMLQRVDVYKTTSSDLIEGGSVGTIDVRTNRPFDFKGYTLSVKGGVNNQDKAKSNDPNLSMMASGRWQTPIGEVGALFGASYVQSKYHMEAAANGLPTPNHGLVTSDAVIVLAQNGDIRRSAENLAFQWRPTAGLELYAEGMSMHYLQNNNVNFFLAFLGDNQQTTTFPGTNVMDTMTSSNAFLLSSTQANALSTVTQQGAIGLRWNAAPGLKVTSEIARTTSRYNYINPILDTNTTAPTAIYQTRGNVMGAMNMSFPGITLTDPKNWTLLQFFDHYGHDAGRSTDGRADATYAPEADGLLKELSSGVRVSSRNADSLHSINDPRSAPSGQVNVTGFNGMSCISPTLTHSLGANQWYQPCANYLLTNTDTLRTAVNGSANLIGWDQGSYIKDVEKTSAWYGKAKLGYDLGKIPVEAVLGVRIVRTEEDLIGNSLSAGQYIVTQEVRSATDILPSLALKLYLRPDLVSRFTSSKTVGRPTFGQLNPATTYTYIPPAAAGTKQTVSSNASGGNPDLKPYTTKNYNATLEWYFSPTGYLAGGLFRHDFTGYVSNMSTKETFQGHDFQVSRPFNTEGGYLQGAEVAYQQFYDKLPGWLSGFGISANATFTEGALTSAVNPIINNRPFAGMSRYSYNVAALYEKNAWSARLAYNWRSRYTDVYNFANTGYDLSVRPISALDGSLSYKVNEHTTINLTGNNLLNFNYRDSFQVFTRDSRYYDRTVGVSLAYKL